MPILPENPPAQRRLDGRTQLFRLPGVRDGAGRVSSSEGQFGKLAVDAAAIRIEAQRADIRLHGPIRHSFGLVRNALFDADVGLQLLVKSRRGELLAVRQSQSQSLQCLVARMLDGKE